MVKSNSDDGCATVDKSGVEDLKRRAGELGLEPKIAFVPKTEFPSAEENRRRKKREKTQADRALKEAKGLRQVNFSDIPVNRIDEVRAAVRAVLSGKAMNTPRRDYLMSFGILILGAIIGSLVVLSTW